MLRREDLWKFSDVSEVITASITRVVMEVETSINFYEPTRLNIPNDNNPHAH
jgi:hypothetical protein